MSSSLVRLAEEPANTKLNVSAFVKLHGINGVPGYPNIMGHWRKSIDSSHPKNRAISLQPIFDASVRISAEIHINFPPSSTL